MRINLTLEIPEAKTYTSLKKLVLELLKTGSLYSCISYIITDFKLVVDLKNKKQ